MSLYNNRVIQATHREIRIPESDVTYIVLSVYLFTLASPIRHKMDHTKVTLLQMKTFKLEPDFAE